MKQFLVERWFLLLLALVLATGILAWAPLRPVAEARRLQDFVVASVLFLMALPLHAEVMWRAVRRPAAPLLGVAVNFGLLPLAAWGVSWGLRPDTAAGLLVAATTPCTLASAAVWTRRAGGNDAAAILVTLVTNVSCFLVTPLWLTAMLGDRSRGIELEFGKMVNNLAMLVVAPMVLAQLLRLIPPLGRWATRRAKPISTLSQCGILVMVFVGAIRTGEMLHNQPASQVFSLWDWGVMIVAVLGVHLAMLALGYALAGGLGMRREDRIAVGIAGSQKTLMVGLKVALDAGVSILPMVIYHVGQLLVDTVIADRWRRRSTTRQTPNGERETSTSDECVPD